MKRILKITISAAVILGVLSSTLVSGTYALIITKSDVIENVFLPPEYTEPNLSCLVGEDIDESSVCKYYIYVENTGNTNGYVRLKPIAKWVNDDGQVYYKQPIGYFYDYNEHDWLYYLDANLDVDFDFCLASYSSSLLDIGIVRGTDGFYYYQYEVAPSDKAYFFDEIYLTDAQGNHTAPDGYHLQIEFIAEIIDCETAKSVWPVTISNYGYLEVDNAYREYTDFIYWS